MHEQAIPPPTILGRGPARSAAGSRRIVLFSAIAVAVVGIATVWVVLTHTRPSYDAFGWLVWGRQVLHWNLNTDGAPSWKPLAFLFTLPYALTGRNAQMWLWVITSTAAALAGALLAGRIAFRLAGPAPRRAWARYAGAAFAVGAVLAINGYDELVLIGLSDPMVTALCLGAVESHLAGERRLTFALLILAAFGRPEAWVFAGLYVVWMWREEPSARVLGIVGVLLIPLSWLIVPALTSHSIFTPGDLALGSPHAIRGDKFTGVFARVGDFYALPIKLMIGAGLVIAAVRRERAWIGLAAAALLWILVEIAFAYHGWSAVPRYLLEPGVLLVPLGGAAFARLLAYTPPWPGPARWLPIAVAAAVLVALVPSTRSRASRARGDIEQSHTEAIQLANLQAAIAKAGGAGLIRSCGQPVAVLTYQSELAWTLGMNVGPVGWVPRASIHSGRPIVLFTAVGTGWRLRPIHTRRADLRRCSRV